MKKLILGLIFLCIPTTAYASSTSSTVINNVNASSTNSHSQVTSHTDITIETDGKTTHYTSDEPNKSIRVESNNGKSKIEVDGKEVSGSDSEVTPTNGTTPSATPGDSKDVAIKGTFIQWIIEQLIRPIKIFSSIFQRF
jgi:hypothetical protein